MKNFVIFLFAAIVAFYVSCKGEHENLKDYSGETIYPARLDTIVASLGYERVELDFCKAGRLPASQLKLSKAVRTVVEYDDVKLEYDSVCSWVNVENLNELKIYRIKVYTEDEHGNRSVPQQADVIPFTRLDRDNIDFGPPKLALYPNGVDVAWMRENVNTESTEFHGLSWEYENMTGATINRSTEGYQFVAYGFEAAAKVNVDITFKVVPILLNGDKLLDTLYVVKSLTVQLPETGGDVTSVEANFESDNPAVCIGGTVNFYNSSRGLVEDLEWTFEGGTPATSTLRNPSVVYTQSGRHKVRLRAYNIVNESIKEEYYVFVPPDFDGKLTAFFPFNGDYNDLGPSKQIPNPTSAMPVTFNATDRKGYANKAAAFSGSGGLVVPDTYNGSTEGPFNFGTGDYSVSCWVKVTSVNSTPQMVWIEGGAGGGTATQTWLRLANGVGGTNAQFSCATENSSATATHITFVGTNGAAIVDGSWHHIVCVRDGVTTGLYLDGVKLMPSAAVVTPATPHNLVSPQNFKIGVQENPLNTYISPFRGHLDDLIVYKKALTLTEIQTLFDM